MVTIGNGHKRVSRWQLSAQADGHGSGEIHGMEFAMHDVLIAVAFATFVIAPCLVSQTPPDVSDTHPHAN